MNNIRCNDEMEKLIYAYADGTLKSEKEKEKVISHIANCDSCLDLIETYYDMHKEKEILDDDKNWKDIPIHATDYGISVLDSELLTSKSKIQVLSSGDKGLPVSLKLPFNNEEITLKLIKSGKKMTVQLQALKGAKKYYLLYGKDKSIASEIDGFVVFTKVPIRSFILSIDMKYFMSIDALKESVL